MVSADPSSYSHNYIIADPLFVDPENGNFHLQVESSAINAGDPEFPLDPDSTRIDIGPYYYHLETKGDTNFDLNIDVLDVVVTVSIILELLEPFNAQVWAADFNSDSEISIQDIILIVESIL